MTRAPLQVPLVGDTTETARQKWAKAVMIAVWMVFLGGPVRDLWAGGHSAPAVAAAATGLACFVASYAGLVYRHTRTPLPGRAVHTLLGVLYVLALVLSLTAGEVWLVLFVYVAVATGAVLPAARAVWGVGACVLALAAVGTHFGARPWWGAWTSLVVPCLLGGFALMSARKTVRTLRELREARAVVAQLAASEERLRLARDLHDLLGHSLSLITLKSELAGRMLPGRPELAAAQVADIERVSRQALVDVREAVSGYRRATLAVELAGARTALESAGITADLPLLPPDERLEPDQEAALAWALREAVTNVVRHSGAARCTVTLETGASGGTGTTDDSHTTGTTSTVGGMRDGGGSRDGGGAGDGRKGNRLRLTVADDGKGPSGAGSEGNGLSGLRERLALVGGSLITSAGAAGGFTLTATVPSVP
ncbi:sensor histidine kinase [Streptomyces albus subsp. chlorinus]|uniref:sensor histidine kinase n=1 Tax=Streptomyces albus TaxID=1888 RepID=UPI00156FE5AD|nr:sensor histidine kinase [Streptomyces albus]NSC23714.1 sensor histidine kinase [Streptomyces albus subsp. chlorinus]